MTQVGNLGFSASTALGTSHASDVIAGQMLAANKGTTGFDTTGLARDLGNLAQTDPDLAQSAFASIKKQMSPVDQANVTRTLQTLATKTFTPVATPKSVPISAQEWTMLKNKDVDGFWESRFQRGDPLADTARQFGWLASKRDTTVNIANNKLDAAITDRMEARYGNDKSVMSYRAYQVRDGEGGTVTRFAPVLTVKGQQMHDAIRNAVRLDLARAHANYVKNDSNHALNIYQATKYHHDVFAKYGIPASTFGGTPVTGMTTEAWATSAAGLWGKGLDPN